MDTQNKQGQGNDPNPAKANKGRAPVDEETHLEDEHTNGVTTTPTPEEVEDASHIPHAPKDNTPSENAKGQGKTVTPTENKNA